MISLTIHCDDWVSVTAAQHSRFNQTGKVTATQSSPSGVNECRVVFSDLHSFWFATTDLILRHAQNIGIPGEDLPND